MVSRTGRVFIALWVTLMALKLLLAWQLPLFVDEAFYWQEGQHLAWAYSDLPGLTAWLVRLGVDMFGAHALAVRLPFVLLGSMVPWLMVRIGTELGHPEDGWLAGCVALLLPLAATLGVLALPDVPMTLATVLCLFACTRLLHLPQGQVAAWRDVGWLTLGLVIGAFSHYRFMAMIGAGGLALLTLPRGRALLRQRRVWWALALGALAWLPLLLWNWHNAEAGLRFQLLDRHPWNWHWDGVLFVLFQVLCVTPLLFWALLQAGRWSWPEHSHEERRRFLARCGLGLVAGFFVLGFVADAERTSFHWPLPGWLALAPLVPALLVRWPHWQVRLLWALAVAGMMALLGAAVALLQPGVRELPMLDKWYPTNFSGWNALAEAVRELHATMPDGTQIVADNFKTGAELGFALDNARIAVLDHPLNHHHGRAPQLRLWGLDAVENTAPILLVVSSTDLKLRALPGYYQALCRLFGPLPAPARVLELDGGRKRYVLLSLEHRAKHQSDDPCATPVMANIDVPLPGARVKPRFLVRGWAMRHGTGLTQVEVTLDGHTIASTRNWQNNQWITEFFPPTVLHDPRHADVAFDLVVDASAFAPGRYRLGLTLTAPDGSVETWGQQWLEIQ